MSLCPCCCPTEYTGYYRWYPGSQEGYILTRGRSRKSNRKSSPQAGYCWGQFERAALAQLGPVVSGLGEMEKGREEGNREFKIVCRYLGDMKCNV